MKCHEKLKQTSLNKWLYYSEEKKILSLDQDDNCIKISANVLIQGRISIEWKRGWRLPTLNIFNTKVDYLNAYATFSLTIYLFLILKKFFVKCEKLSGFSLSKKS